ncbi:MAG TPA: hypothetical protein PK006_00180 [Saprospiraceae bacterium]|nr:hypothetical protein [Saprospiraceae bacterium]
MEENLLSVKIPDGNDGYHLPENYFDQLTESLLTTKIIAESSDKLKTPETYFGELTDKLIDQMYVTQHLYKIENGMQIPKFYFEELSDKIHSQSFFKDQDIKNIDGFKTPENYFDHLTDQLLSQTNEEARNSDKIKIISLKQWRVWTVAASIVMMAAIGLWLGKSNNTANSTQELSWNAISDDALIDYAMENITDYNHSELEELFTVGDETTIQELEDLDDAEIEKLLKQNFN